MVGTSNLGSWNGHWLHDLLGMLFFFVETGRFWFVWKWGTKKECVRRYFSRLKSRYVWTNPHPFQSYWSWFIKPRTISIYLTCIKRFFEMFLAPAYVNFEVALNHCDLRGHATWELQIIPALSTRRVVYVFAINPNAINSINSIYI
jgi:hypothetical protein